MLSFVLLVAWRQARNRAHFAGAAKPLSLAVALLLISFTETFGAQNVHEAQAAKNPERQLIVRFKSGTSAIKQQETLGRLGRPRPIRGPLSRQGVNGARGESLHV